MMMLVAGCVCQRRVQQLIFAIVASGGALAQQAEDLALMPPHQGMPGN